MVFYIIGREEPEIKPGPFSPGVGLRVAPASPTQGRNIPPAAVPLGPGARVDDPHDLTPGHARSFSTPHPGFLLDELGPLIA